MGRVNARARAVRPHEVWRHCIVLAVLLSRLLSYRFPVFVVAFYTISVTARRAPSRDNCTTRIFFRISAIKSVRLYAG